MIQRLLVANRAEIASRVFRTCRRLGITTVAVHSDADATLPYVREADVAVRLPGVSPADTYLRADLLVDAARRTGADAVHPGYGFLSENADFGRAVETAGLVWVGPTPESLEQMGSKVEAKKLAETVGVPVLGEVAIERATEADLPLLVKASAGGGGRGMRVVRSLARLPVEVEHARAEAASAFGDGTVFVEPYVEHARHVEVQVVGDVFGHVQVFGERDCSMQRRHQKVVEESPAPGLTEGTRAALHAAAQRIAVEICYRGAGTVEFLYDPATERFWFLEMNTRLQVEHPVTELVHGVDLVELQIGVAEQEKLPVLVGDRPAAGHAIEVRLYAEDPAADYQPQSGLLTTFEIPAEDGIRVDAGYESGSRVSTHYDAMLAKVVAHAPTREQAARQLAGVLRRSRIHGVTTNRDLLVDVLRSDGFLAGDVSTDLLQTLNGGGTPQPTPVELVERRAEPVEVTSAVAAALALAERTRRRRTVQQGIPVGWRNVVSQPQRTTFTASGREVTVEWWVGRDGYHVDDMTVVAASPSRVTSEVGGLRTKYDVAVTGLPGHETVDVDSVHGHLRLTRVPRFTDPTTTVAAGSLLAPMPGTVVGLAVAAGEAVAAGRPVLVLEAMKMQHTVSAPAAGTITRLEVRPGDQVTAGQVLAVVEATGEADA